MFILIPDQDIQQMVSKFQVLADDLLIRERNITKLRDKFESLTLTEKMDTFSEIKNAMMSHKNKVVEFYEFVDLLEDQREKRKSVQMDEFPRGILEQIDVIYETLAKSRCKIRDIERYTD